MYLNRIVDNNLINKEKVKYLYELKLIVPSLFENAKIGLIRGDLQFNNIIISPSNDLSIIDFEKIKISYLDREYDPINRMIRNPNSFVNNGINGTLDQRNFKYILEYLKQHIDEISDNRFMDRLLFFDLMNSLMWFSKYPNNLIYNDIMFEKSKKLLK